MEAWPSDPGQAEARSRISVAGWPTQSWRGSRSRATAAAKKNRQFFGPLVDPEAAGLYRCVIAIGAHFGLSIGLFFPGASRGTDRARACENCLKHPWRHAFWPTICGAVFFTALYLMHDIVRVDEDSELFSLGLERGRPRGALGYPKGMGQFYRVPRSAITLA